MEQPGVVAGYFALRFSHKFLSIFCAYLRLHWADHSDLGIIGKIFSSCRSWVGWCQFWSKVMTSEVEERPRLVKAGYGRRRSQWVKSSRLQVFSSIVIRLEIFWYFGKLVAVARWPLTRGDRNRKVDLSTKRWPRPFNRGGRFNGGTLLLTEFRWQ